MEQQLELFEIPSPCIGVCENEGRYCKGCFRSREERQGWFGFDEPTKREVLRLCAQRRKRASQKKALDKLMEQDR